MLSHLDQHGDGASPREMYYSHESDLDNGRLMEEALTAPSDAEVRRALVIGDLTPLPRREFAVLCFLRILDPLNFTQIFPYINELIWDLGVTDDPKKIGFYSGVVESVFAIAQLVTMYPWGILSDTAGRRPVILAGAAGLASSTLVFGLSQDFRSILISRSLAGLFSGNVAVIPSVLGEITSKNHEAIIYSLFGVFWPIGTILGPVIGGTLSNPTVKFPVFFNLQFFQKYPYFLPCCVTTGFNVLGFILCYFFLTETLGKNKGDYIREQSTATRGYGSTANHQKRAIQKTSSEKRYTVKQLLSRPIIQAICASVCVLSFISTAFEVVFVLFCYSPIGDGGLGFSPQEIGFALALSGIGAALLSALIMPNVLARFDHSQLYHFSMKLWTIPFLALPLLNFIAKTGLKPGTTQLDEVTTIKLWIGVAVLLVVARVAFVGFSINMLLVKAFVPDPDALGATYGLVQFSICLSRFFSPTLTSTLYVVSHQYDSFDGNLWILVFIVLSWFGSIFSKRVVYHAHGCHD